jgi:hypothetical protein
MKGGHGHPAIGKRPAVYSIDFRGFIAMRTIHDSRCGDFRKVACSLVANTLAKLPKTSLNGLLWGRTANIRPVSPICHHSWSAQAILRGVRHPFVTLGIVGCQASGSFSRAVLIAALGRKHTSFFAAERKLFLLKTIFHKIFLIKSFVLLTMELSVWTLAAWPVIRPF